MAGRAIHNVPDFYDYLKHITTLSTAALVLLASLAEKFSRSGRGKWLFSWGLISFLASMICSVICMFFVISIRRYGEGEPAAGEGDIIMVSFFLSLISLIVGTASLTAFGISNFRQKKDS
jgi:hypothetical protein